MNFKMSQETSPFLSFFLFFKYILHSDEYEDYSFIMKLS